MAHGYKQLFHAFIRDESGLSAVEYGLLAAGIAVAVYSAVQGVGNDLGTIFNNLKTDLTST
jgi:pilus assembly protein Flp/PilA